MAHEIMFDADDPVLARLREVCLALPGAREKVSHGRPTFFTTKVFATYGGVVKGNHDPEPHRQSLLVLLDPAELEAMLADERCYFPAYVGPSGWIGLDLGDDPDAVDWTEVAELVDDSYRNTAPRALVRELDAGE